MFQIAWAVSRTFEETDGPLIPVEFNEEEINIGNAWQPFRNEAVIPSMGSGIYYVNLLISACQNKKTYVILNRNGLPLLKVSHKIINYKQATGREQSTIVKLTQGDIL